VHANESPRPPETSEKNGGQKSAKRGRKAQRECCSQATHSQSLKKGEPRRQFTSDAAGKLGGKRDKTERKICKPKARWKKKGAVRYHAQCDSEEAASEQVNKKIAPRTVKGRNKRDIWGKEAHRRHKV